MFTFKWLLRSARGPPGEIGKRTRSVRSLSTCRTRLFTEEIEFFKFVLVFPPRIAYLPVRLFLLRLRRLRWRHANKVSIPGNAVSVNKHGLQKMNFVTRTAADRITIADTGRPFRATEHSSSLRSLRGIFGRQSSARQPEKLELEKSPLSERSQEVSTKTAMSAEWVS